MLFVLAIQAKVNWLPPNNAHHLKYTPITFNSMNRTPLSVETKECGQLENSPVGNSTLFHLVDHRLCTRAFEILISCWSGYFPF